MKLRVFTLVSDTESAPLTIESFATREAFHQALREIMEQRLDDIRSDACAHNPSLWAQAKLPEVDACLEDIAKGEVEKAWELFTEEHLQREDDYYYTEETDLEFPAVSEVLATMKAAHAALGNSLPGPEVLAVRANLAAHLLDLTTTPDPEIPESIPSTPEAKPDPDPTTLDKCTACGDRVPSLTTYADGAELCERCAGTDRPHGVPVAILEAIATAEASRLKMPYAEMLDTLHQASAVYFPRYTTCSPGYNGPVVVVLWAASPGAVSTFTTTPEGQWEHCNSTAW